MDPGLAIVLAVGGLVIGYAAGLTSRADTVILERRNGRTIGKEVPWGIRLQIIDQDAETIETFERYRYTVGAAPRSGGPRLRVRTPYSAPDGEPRETG